MHQKDESMQKEQKTPKTAFLTLSEAFRLKEACQAEQSHMQFFFRPSDHAVFTTYAEKWVTKSQCSTKLQWKE